MSRDGRRKERRTARRAGPPGTRRTPGAVVEPNKTVTQSTKRTAEGRESDPYREDGGEA